MLKKIWNFIWHEDSIWSWLVNIVLAFIIVKFLLYPGLGFLLGTSFPVVAVMSSSMEHQVDFDQWWEQHEDFYTQQEITKEEFKTYKFMHGFNKGDIMVLVGDNTLTRGDVIVFNGMATEPIIHRVVNSNKLQTKGDNNPSSRPDEINIDKNRVLGKAVVRVPYLGWLKLAFVGLFY